MIFWVGILISFVMAALAARKGLYESWTILFNVVISVYLAMTLTPVITELLSLGSGSTVSAIVTLTSALCCFGLLYGLAYMIFLCQFEVRFPKIIDYISGGFAGFLAALLGWALIIFVISTSPIGQKKPFSNIGLNVKTASESGTIAYMRWWTNRIDDLVGKGKEHNKIETLVTIKIEEAMKKITNKKKEIPEKTEKPEVEVVEEKTIKPFDLGNPPELAFEDI